MTLTSTLPIEDLVEVIADAVCEGVGDMNEGQVFGAREYAFIAKKVIAAIKDAEDVS